MNRRLYVRASLVILQIVNCHAKNWMYSKSWIQDYRTSVKYGLPSQSAPTEYSMETHKICVVQREEERYFDEGGYDYRESSTVLGTMRNVAVRNKGEKHVGQLMSDLIIVPKNVTHVLPSLRVDMILLERASEGAVNFIGLLESPKNDGYSSFSTSISRTKKNSSVSYEFVLCGNYGRNDMLSIGYMEIHYNTDYDLDNSVTREAAVIDPYLFMVVVKSLAFNDTSLATCEELNARGAIFDNTVPGIYLPFSIFRRFMRVLGDHASKQDFPVEMKIWERRKYVCFEGPVDWKSIPEMRIEFFAREDEAVEVSYSGESLVKRYYTKNSGETTFCYIFAIRKGNDDRLILGRSAFEGVRLIFNRTRRTVSFLDNACCGPRIKLRRTTETKEKMSLCLPRSLRSGTSLDTYWIWIMLTAIILAILTCLFSVPRSLSRGTVGRPTIHIFIPQTETLKCERNCQEKGTDPTE